MSTDTPAGDPPEPADLQAQLEALREDVADLQTAVEEDAEESSASHRSQAGEDEANGKMSIVATKGTLDMAYPPLILATTAAAFGWDVTVFHTFWGLDVLHEGKVEDLKLSAVGNPSMPMPNALAALPGMDAVATWMMERRIDDEGVATVGELLDVAVESGVELQACQMTMDLMGYEAGDLFDEVEAGVGAATALEDMADADVQLLV